MESTTGVGKDNDPGTWSIDQVIREFCQDAISTQSIPDLARLVQAIPHRDDLEQRFRDNDVNGDTLLALDMTSIRDDLGITSLGQRRAIMRAIDHLRLHSESYQHAAFQANAIARLQSPLHSAPQMSHLDFPFPPQSPVLSVIDRVRSQVGRPTHSPSSSLGLGTNHFTFLQHSPVTNPETPLREPRATEYEPTPAAPNNLENSAPTTARLGAIKDDSTTSKSVPTVIQGSLEPLDLLQASVDAELSQNYQANDPAIIVPVVRDGHLVQKPPKKRVVPTLIRHTEERDSNSQGSYLSKESKPIQDTFYVRLSTGWSTPLYVLPGDNEEDFYIADNIETPGRKQVIARQMKYFLRQKTLINPENGSLLKIPYGPKRSQGLSKQLFTLFPHNENRPVVRTATDFPQLLKDAVLPNSLRHELPQQLLKTPSKHDDGAQPQSYTDLDEFQSLLARYPVATHEEGLPVYGDSGDEGEFDLETWDEIEQEKAEKQISTSVMTTAAVESTINETLEAFRSEWRETKLPKHKLKAYLLWMRSAKQKSRKAALENCQFWRDRHTEQLQKLKEAILKDTWHKPSDVKHQCQSIEPTLHSIEEHVYTIQVLLSDHQPERPNKAERQHKIVTQKPPLEDGEEDVDSDDIMNEDDSEFLSDSSDAGSIHHEPDGDEDVWNPVILKEEKTTPAAKTMAKPEQLMPQENPAASNEIHDHDADVETDIDDAIVTPRQKRKMFADKGKSPAKLNSKAPITPSRKFVEPLNLDRAKSGKISDSDTDHHDKPEFIPSKYRSKGMSLSSAIDLTKSSPPSAEKHGDSASSDMNVRTPELNPQPDGSRACRRFSMLTDNLSGPNLSGCDMPRAEDFHGIKGTDWALIEDNSDGRRALAKAVYVELDRDAVQKLVDLTSGIPEHNKLGRELLVEGFVAYQEDKKKAKQTLSQLVLLFMVYHNGQNLFGKIGPSRDQINQAFESIDSTQWRFFILLSRFLHIANGASKQKASLQGTPQSDKKRKREAFISDNSALDDTDLYRSDDLNSDVVELHQPPSSIKKRKRAVAESQEANKQQRSDQQRIEEQERRRIAVEKRVAQMPKAKGGSLCPVNFTEPIVYLDPHIASRVKPHQLKGIQFMWREIIEDPKQQGCILAHTMGLGKTMQVISLLVTIAQCARSDNPRIRDHVPLKSRSRKTLILCPAALVENWFDELIMWSPNQYILGEIHKHDSQSPRSLRLWSQNGGVLLISYTRFVRIINAAQDPTKIGQQGNLSKLEKILLEEPALVVADEAHNMKNPKSALNRAASRFKTLSRIALTGSPLNNHLEEYHTMVDWIAPGYLGTMVQFRSKYSEPISEGLYAESTPLERRTALRKLHVLKRDLDPKINRADISAIEKDMPTKTEYFITIPLTDLQKEAYNTYVQYMQHTVEPGGRGAQAKLWGWIAILQILCNHPKCCYDKLRDRQSELLEKSEAVGDESEMENEIQSEKENLDGESPLPADMIVDTQGPMLEAMQRVLEVFDRSQGMNDLKNLNLSYRTWLVHDIIREAVKIDDKTLIFSHSIPTLNYLEEMLLAMKCKYIRLDGTTKVGDRQNMTKKFNNTSRYDVFLISMKAGGLGMNLQGANRVIIFDFMYNPSWEEQAIGRAYRLGQRKPVLVYRFRAGGTFEGVMFNKAMFKKQMFSRVVDHKNFARHASKNIAEWLFPVQETEQKEFDEHIGKDPHVLDKIIKRVNYIRNIELTETFQREDNEKLDDEDKRVAEKEFQDQRLLRENPAAFFAKEQAQRLAQNPHAMGHANPFVQSPHFQVGQSSNHVNGVSTPQSGSSKGSGLVSYGNLPPFPLQRSSMHTQQIPLSLGIHRANEIPGLGSTVDGAVEHIDYPRNEDRLPPLY
ncbi:hypothetical protein LTR84_008150 [Exophiala bonariae]|uniref:Uncharacterized protein n=1 Tax=Exophiala bonariae TaxID=1690606 RepID=A0AAV9NNQ6_9EURO|nr:hypothetical protein LTR84_008150 [Exophiala bonariae]